MMGDAGVEGATAPPGDTKQGGGGGLAALLSSGLDYCRRRGLTPVVVAMPDPVEPATVSQLLRTADVVGVVISPDTRRRWTGDDARVGVMRPEEYSWVLPQVRASSVLYVGPRRTFTFRMAKRALVRRMLTVVHSTPLAWQCEHLSVYIARRVLEKLQHALTKAVQVCWPSRTIARVREWDHGRFSRYLTPGTRKLAGSRQLVRLRRLLTDPDLPVLPRDRFVQGRVVHFNSALAWGGAERQLVNTLLGTGRVCGMQPSLVCEHVGNVADHDFFLEHLDASGVPVEELARTQGVRADEADTRVLERVAARVEELPRSLADDVLYIARDLLRRRPRVVHGWQDSTCIKLGLAAAIVGVPRIVLSTRNLAPFRFPYWMPYMWPGYRALLQDPRVVLINNSEAGARDYARWLGVDSGRVKVVRNGFSPERFQRASPQAVAEYRREIGIPDGVRIVGSVFRFYPEKDPLLWVRTAARIARRRDDVAFLVLGTGPMKEDMLKSMRSLGLDGRMWMPGTDKNVARMLSALDAFMLTSKMEGTPNVIIEAQFLGVPVVCTDAGGSAECIEHGVTGWVVRNRRPSSLARKVLKVLDDESWRARACARAPALASGRFGLDRMLRETVELYREPTATATVPGNDSRGALANAMQRSREATNSQGSERPDHVEKVAQGGGAPDRYEHRHGGGRRSGKT